MKKYLVLIICMFQKNIAEQFIYPVASLHDENHLVIVYQKSLQDIELWIWNTQDHCAIKGLSSFLTPANLRILPSGNGFSFIDNDYIKIKEFEKRSPRTLPIYEPIGLFSSMNWIDDDTFYFVARHGEFFQIFQGDLQANIQKLTCDCADALYPQKINSDLFYIQRNANNQTSIIHTTWKPKAIDDFILTIDEEIIIEPSDHQFCYLHMISNQEGFFLQAPTTKLTAGLYEFNSYHLIKTENKWLAEKLFKFNIPVQYLTGSNKLHESIEPFLPNYTCKDVIYFVDWQHDIEQLELFKFDIITKTIESAYNQLSYRNKSQKIFAPFSFNGKIYCGFILPNQNRSFQYNFETGHIFFDLPSFQEK